MIGESRRGNVEVFSADGWPLGQRGSAPSGECGSLVGRTREMRELEERIGATLGGRGQVVLLAGEAGIGKTRLAEEAAGAARARAARVLVGRCEEDEGTPAYWPWVQIVRAYAGTRDDPWSDSTEVETAAVATLCSGTAAPEAGRDAGATARFRLFDAIGRVVKRIARDAGVVLVLDDLHSADHASLMLLRFLAREIREHPVMIVGTYRDTDVGSEHSLTETTSELRRHSHCQQIVLTGLGREDVSRLIEHVGGGRPSPSVVARVHTVTEGNPFFVSEVARLLATHGALADAARAGPLTTTVPQGVRDVVTRRLGRLSPACHDVLTTAAVIGRDFELSLLGCLTGLAADRLLELLDEAVRTRILAAAPAALARYGFAHALIRETLCASLDLGRRVQLHRRVGEALEAMGEPERHLSELAYHFYEAARGSHVDQALAYALGAAERALGGLAYEDAVVQYERALQLLDATLPPDPSRRCDALLGLGTAETKAGDWQKGRTRFAEAAGIARRLDDPDRLARAAVGYATWLDGMTMNPALVGLLEEALGAIGEGDGALRALLLGHLARALYFREAIARRTALGRDAVAMARRLGDAGTLAQVLTLQRHALWGPGGIEQRLAAAAEIVELAERTTNLELAFTGRAYRVADLLEGGDPVAADAEIAACARLLDALGRPPALAWLPEVWRTARALGEGRFEEAERLILQAWPLAGQTGSGTALMCLGTQLLFLRRETGLHGMDASVADAIERYPDLPVLRAYLAWIHAELGRREEAARAFAALAATDFDLPHDYSWLAAMVLLADVCSFLGDAPRAASLYRQLLPHAHLNATLAIGVYCYGGVAHHLGRLAATMGRLDDAARHFEDALALNTRLRMPPNVARTEYAYACLLLARDAGGDRGEAAELLADALDTAHRLGMTTLAQRIDALPTASGEIARRPRRAVRASVVGLRTEAPSDAVFRREGDYWLVSYAGKAFRLKDSVGLHYIAFLLAHPGRDLLACDLVALVRQPWDGAGDGHATLRRVGGDAGELLDGRAKAAYRQRLRALKTALEDAESCGNAEEALRIRAEMAFVAQELARGLGLGGRGRRAGSPVERARVSITVRIRTAAAKIAEQSPALAAHLAASLKTGAYCSYAPDRRVAPVWTLDRKGVSDHAT